MPTFKPVSAGRSVGDESLDLNLTVRERIDYPFLIANQILNIQRVIIKDSYDPAEIRDAVETLIAMIPLSWRETDDYFMKDIQSSIKKITVDIRPVFGGVQASPEICAKMGWSTTRIDEETDHFKAFNAVINLLDRKRMLTRRNWIEKVTGAPADGKPTYEVKPNPVLPEHIRDAQENVKKYRDLLKQVDFTAKDLKELEQEIEAKEKARQKKLEPKPEPETDLDPENEDEETETLEPDPEGDETEDELSEEFLENLVETLNDARDEEALDE